MSGDLVINDYTLPSIPTIDQIRALEHELVKLPPAECPITHHFADGMYGREMFIPAGVMLTGRTHKHGHLNFLMSGEIIVWTEEGMKRLTAPQILPSSAGIKRVGYAVTDCIWATVHITDLTDHEEIVEEMTIPEFIPQREVRAIE